MSYKKTVGPGCRLVAMLSLFAPVAVRAEAITYDFTGTVTESLGIYSSISAGTAVSGTFTFDLASATSISGTLGSPSGWTASTVGGTLFGTSAPPLSQYVFSDAVKVSTVSWSTPSGGAYDSGSTATAAYNSTSSPPYLYTLQTGNIPTSDTSVAQGEQLQLAGSSVLWSADGLPKFSAASLATGEFFSQTSNAFDAVYYNIDSMTPAVPLPAAAWLLLSGLGGLGVFARKRLAA